MSAHAPLIVPQNATAAAAASGSVESASAAEESENGGFSHHFGKIPCAPPLRVSERDEPIEREADCLASALSSDGDGSRMFIGATPAVGQGRPAGQPDEFPVATRLALFRDGHPLAPDEREKFEAQLGRDLRDVRIHTDAQAAAGSEGLGARAFTHGTDIFFADGEYQPETAQGRWLLAHEIVHTQQDHPGVIACFADGASIPALPEEAIGDEIEGALRADPSDTSGRVAERLAQVPPRQRATVVSRLRARRIPGQYGDGLSRATGNPAQREPPIGDQPRTRRSDADRDSDAAGGEGTDAKSRLQQKTAHAPLPVQITAPQRPPPPPPATTPSISAASGAPPQRAPSAEPAAGGAQPESVGETAGAPALQAGPAGETEDRPLRLADLLEQPAEPQPAPASDTTPAFSPAAEATSESSSAPVEIGAPSVLDAASPVEESLREETDVAGQMAAFAAQLEAALADAETSLDTQAETVRNSVRRQAASARAGIRAEGARTTSEIRAGSTSLLSQIESAVRAAHAQINTARTARAAEAAVAGSKSQGRIRGIFSGHRDTVNTTVSNAVRDAERLRTQKANSARLRNRTDIATAYSRGGAKMRSYPNTDRGAFIGGAAFDVAEGAAKEMQKQEPDIVAGIAEITAPLPEHFRAQGAQALDGFDQHLPEIIESVNGAVAQTTGDLSRKTADAHRHLDETATQMRTEIGALTTTALAQVAAFGPQLEAQLDRALGQVTRTLATTPANVMERISPPVVEAIEMLRTADASDVEAAGQLTEVLTTFLEESASSTGATMQQAGEAGAQRFQQMRAGARQTMQAQKARCETTWQGTRRGLSTTLPRTIDGVDAGLGVSVGVLRDSLGETERSIRDQLTPAVTGLSGSFRDSLRDAERQIDGRINDGLSKNGEALASLGAKMQEAADDAAWEFDHPVLSALSFVAGIIVGIAAVLAIVLVLLVITIALSSVLGISLLAAGLVLLAGMVGFMIGYGFGARLAAGQGVGEALGGAIVDFGRAVPGMLYDMTGIPKLRRAFSDERMTPYQRGKLIGEGGTELVLAIFMVRGAAKGIAGRFRSLPRVPPPTVRPPGAARLPLPEAPRPPVTVEPPVRVPATIEAPQAPRIPLPEAPRPPVAIEPPPRAPAPIEPARPRFEVFEGGREPSATPRPRPRLEVVKGEGGRPGLNEPTAEPLPSEAQPQRAQVAAGAEGREPVLGETTPQQPRRFGVIEGGAEPAGGRSRVDVRASAETGGGGRGPRPEGPRGTPESPSAPRGTSPRSGGARPRSTPAAEPRPAAAESGSSPSSSEPAPARPRPSRSRTPKAEEPAPAKGQTAPREGARPRRARGGRGRGGGGEHEPRPTKAERATQGRRDADTAAAQREFQGVERPARRPQSLEDILGDEGDLDNLRGIEEPGEFGGAEVRRGPGGRQVVSEDRVVAEAAGSAMERPMVRQFRAAQPPTGRTFGSSLGNWARLRETFPRIAELFSGGSRPDGVAIDPASRTIELFDATARPNATHWEGSLEYMERLANDPIMKAQFDGWTVRVREAYWEDGFQDLSPTRSTTIRGGSGGTGAPPSQ